MSFTVTIQPSGHVFQIEDDETILDAALRHGFALSYGCRNGACGACLGRLLAGQVDYPNGPPRALDDAAIAAGKAVFCQAMAGSDLVIETREISAVRDIVVKTLPVRVSRMQRVAHDVMLLRLKLPMSERLQFLAGQYVDILMKDGRRRSFSLANAPHDDAELELHVRHVPDGRFADHVFGDMQEKDLLRIEGPLGSFFLREDSERPILLMAGGTGFAPIKAMLEHAFAAGIDRPIHFFRGARAKRDLYLDELPQGWAAAHANFRYTPVLSEPLPENAWQGETGFVHEALLKQYPDLSGYDVYMAGPPPMIQAAHPAFVAHGLPEDRLFSDAFEYGAAAEARTVPA